MNDDTDTVSERTPRELETRTAETDFSANWIPQDILPMPHKQDGWVHRWIRTGSLGNADNTNVSRRFREGWQPVKAKDVPELQLMSDIDSRFGNEGFVEVGGLLLCKAPEELMESRKQHFSNLGKQQQQAVDNQLMGENDPRMPLNPVDERTSRTTFGSGR